MGHDRFRPVTMQQVSVGDVLKPPYSASAAAAVAQTVREFIPYAGNFSVETVYIDAHNYRGFLNILVNLPTQRPPGSVRVALSFPEHFPQANIAAYIVEASGRSVANVQHPYVEGNGRVRVERLISEELLGQKGNILSLLMAIKTRLDEQPLTGMAASKTPSTPIPLASGSDANDGYTQDIATALAQDAATMHNALAQEAAEKVVIDLNGKALPYLTTRRQALRYMAYLTPANEQLRQAKDVLVRYKAELLQYLPTVGDVEQLIKQLDGHQDTLEEHEGCLAPEDATQGRLLELMAEIHASEDMLNLFEEGLKTEQLSCDDYVKCVSDVGREQFIARFLHHRLVEQLGLARRESSLVAAAAPSTTDDNANGEGPAVVQTSSIAIPQRLTPLEALLKDFPSLDRGLVNDVLANVNGDVKQARQQLRMMNS